MGIVAQSLYSLGGRVIGVLPQALDRSDIRLYSVEERLIVFPTMYELADALLPALLNVTGFFNSLLAFLEHSV